nr:LysM peptidoglycan-binding domain-containing protein [Vagococcus allomyrinae]
MKSSTSTAPSSSVTKESNSTVDSSSLEASKAAEAEKQAAAAQKAADEAKAAELAAQQNQQTDQNANNTATDQQNQAVSGDVHVVQPGDNIYRLSIQYGISEDQLRALNGITGNDISVGQQLKVK